MNRKLSIDVPYEGIVEFCKKWGITEFALFGSVLRDDFRPESDIDVLVKFAEDSHATLLDMATMEEELERLLGRKVDLVSRGAVESSRNYIRRKAILSSLETLYAAA